MFPVDLAEARVPEGGFESFDAFFTRALRPGARPMPEDPGALACPCDGTLSQCGPISDGRIVQAKGRDFTVSELLAGDPRAADYEGGRFLTVYLAPHDYHRVHAPVDGRLVSEIRVPGRLFSVSAATGRVIDRLYARNERMVALFETDEGPIAVIMVAAMLVAGIETTWDPHGERRPGRRVRRLDPDPAPRLARGEELGRFHWGSTVVLLAGPGHRAWRSGLVPGRTMRLGEPLT